MRTLLVLWAALMAGSSVGSKDSGKQNNGSAARDRPDLTVSRENLADYLSVRSVEMSKQCPDTNGNYTRFLPHPFRCEEFYMCDSGVAWKLLCPPGLHFNENKSVCDFPTNVNCSFGRGLPSFYSRQDSAARPATKGKFQPASEDHPENFKLRSLKIDTADGKQAPGNVDAAGSGEVDGSGTEPAPEEGGHGLQDDDGAQLVRQSTRCLLRSERQFLRDPHNCSLFYQCHNGVEYLYQCPPLLSFDEKLQACDVPRDPGCTEDPPIQLHPGNLHSLLAAVQSLDKDVMEERQDATSLLLILLRDIGAYATQAIRDRAAGVLDQLGQILQTRIDNTQTFLRRLNTTLNVLQS